MILAPQKRISEQALKVWRISGIIKVAVGWVLTAVVIFQWQSDIFFKKNRD